MVDVDRQPVLDALREATGGELAHVVVDVACGAAAARTAPSLLRRAPARCQCAPAGPLVTHRYGLADADRAIDVVAGAVPGADPIKVVVTPNGAPSS